MGEGNPYVLLEVLEKTIHEDNVLVKEYCEFWEELCGFLSKFGRLLSFVVDDVMKKVIHLRDMHESNPDSYRSVKCMALWEQKENIIYREKPKSGIMNLLTLHRALLFIVQLISNIYDAKETDGIPHVAGQAYDSTLGRYHPWITRKLVHAAMYVLPNKEQFLQIMRGPMPASEDEYFYKKFNKNTKILRTRVEAIFVEFNVIL